MPEYVRRTVSANHPRVLCPLLEEGSVLPEGLTDGQRLCLTQGRLAKDFEVDMLLQKKDVLQSYGMSITIVNQQEPMKMQAAPSSEEPTKSFSSRIKETVKSLWTKK